MNLEFFKDALKKKYTKEKEIHERHYTLYYTKILGKHTQRLNRILERHTKDTLIEINTILKNTKSLNYIANLNRKKILERH